MNRINRSSPPLEEDTSRGGRTCEGANFAGVDSKDSQGSQRKTKSKRKRSHEVDELQETKESIGGGFPYRKPSNK